MKPDLIAPGYQLEGVQACCRTAIFYSPRSLSCRWELSDPTGRGRVAGLPRGTVAGAAADSIEMASRLGQNVIAYATGRELNDKLDARLIVRGDDGATRRGRGAIRVARLATDATALEARRALPNLIGIASEQIAANFETAAEDPELDADLLAEYAILWVHGRTDFSWDNEQRQQLRDFLDSGGILIADAICGSPEFTTAFRREISAVLPDSPLLPMAADNPALTPAFGGFDLRNVTIRMPTAQAGTGQVGRRRGPPQLEIATIDSQTTVFLSPLDLSCALESPNSIQCPGYDTNDAARIGINLILFALQQ